jgi:tetratricopeptide (TPR) repeat protein
LTNDAATPNNAFQVPLLAHVIENHRIAEAECRLEQEVDLEERAEKAEEAEDWQSALVLWKAAAAKDQDAVSFCRYGQVAEKLGKWDEAESAFSRALILAPNLSPAMELMGDLWATRTDRDDVESLTTAKEWFLKALDRERSARVLTFLGCTYRALEELDRARTTFEEAVMTDPNYEEALYNLGKMEEETNPSRAVELLERAIETDPDYSLAHQVLGRLYQKAKDLPRAEYHFRRSLEIDPADYWTNLYVANLLGVLGRNDEAEQQYRFATTLHPELTGGVELFARFLDSIGKPEEAERVRNQIKRSGEEGPAVHRD